MKKFNASLFALCAILLNAATTNAWEWPWNKYKWQASTTQSWKEYGTQKGKVILLGINHHRKTAIGVGALAIIGYKYRKQIRTKVSDLWADYFIDPPQTIEKLNIFDDINDYEKLFYKGNLQTPEESTRFKSVNETLLQFFKKYEDNKLKLSSIQKETLKLLREWRFTTMVRVAQFGVTRKQINEIDRLAEELGYDQYMIGNQTYKRGEYDRSGKVFE